MPPILLTPQLAAEYKQLFASCAITASKQATVVALANKLVGNKARYVAVAQTVGAPWQFVAVIHNMESDQNFKRHLHNGDPLTHRTVQVPAGRPAAGAPPFTWEASADDALRLKNIDRWTDWSVAGVLFKLEEFNGMGYRLFHPQVRTPYLWSFCQHYVRGKFVADGKFSSTAVSQQCGAAVLLRRLEQMGEALGAGSAPEWDPRFDAVRFAPGEVVPLAADLQRFLNQRTRAGLTVDGRAGKGTSDAVRVSRGHFLPGDPRG